MGGRLTVLDQAECQRRLSDRAVGRVAVSVGALPAIFPVNYAVLDGDVVFRTGPGSKLDAAVAGAVVAFEIDHVDAMSHAGWSVLVVGVARKVTDPATLARAARLPLSSWADGDREDAFVRIESGRVTGRQVGVPTVWLEPPAV
jgi:nitroimidazol reductase NimA-like FMN-containing flavoprotein (pyridoxamine 5'-phosphate oxidase superfamily)